MNRNGRRASARMVDCTQLAPSIRTLPTAAYQLVAQASGLVIVRAEVVADLQGVCRQAGQVGERATVMGGRRGAQRAATTPASTGEAPHCTATGRRTTASSLAKKRVRALYT